ncbi:hypothetical protein PIB30_033838 [Stylosanthes scabra]|uniref:Aminotransferase-like plant mobile domain-containing protein n=1 Tax=Stylosanthes scabra TaxID=79078 RepID=A0ABU6ZAD3_9FABA|nr:hypothetical protein [Stylosanthes scabra]
MAHRMFPGSTPLDSPILYPYLGLNHSDNRVVFTNPPLSKKPFPEPPSFGLLLSMDKTMKPGFDSIDCKVLGEFVEKPTLHMGHTLLQCRLRRGEFSWTSCKSEAPTQVNRVWNKWIFTILFEEGGDFLSRLEEAGVAEAIRTSAEDVVMLLQLPVFGNLDITNFYVDLDLRKLARDLRCNLSNAGRYAKELSKNRRVSKSHSRDKRSDARRGSSKSRGMVDEDETRSSKKKKCTVNYSYSNWSRYFFGDFLNGEFVPASDDIPADLKEVAFIAYWLSKYIFLGPADECMGQGVFLLACVIARGRRVPLAPLYLGGLYARLDHFSEQLKIAHGRFPVLAYIDEIFLQLFLFEHFPRFAPTRKLPTILPDKKASPRTWSWGSAYPSRCLEEVIELEENFSFRPYTSSPGASHLHHFYSSNYESDRNGIIDGKEGSYDFWLLYTSPTPLPGLIIMDRDYPSGAIICPITYRPDRVSRQLRWDQDPKNVEPAFYPIEDLMKKVLFRRSLQEFDPGLVVFFDRIGDITMEYVDYLKCLKQHIRQYEDLDAKCYKSQPSSKRKCDDPAPVAEPAKRGKPPSSNAKVVRRNPPEKPVKPPADATPPPISSRSKVLPSSITKARGSSTVGCSPKSLQTPVKGTSSETIYGHSHLGAHFGMDIFLITASTDFSTRSPSKNTLDLTCLSYVSANLLCILAVGTSISAGRTASAPYTKEKRVTPVVPCRVVL